MFFLKYFCRFFFFSLDQHWTRNSYQIFATRVTRATPYFEDSPAGPSLHRGPPWHPPRQESANAIKHEIPSNSFDTFDTAGKAFAPEAVADRVEGIPSTRSVSPEAEEIGDEDGQVISCRCVGNSIEGCTESREVGNSKEGCTESREVGLCGK